MHLFHWSREKTWLDNRQYFEFGGKKNRSSLHRVLFWALLHIGGILEWNHTVEWKVKLKVGGNALTQHLRRVDLSTEQTRRQSEIELLEFVELLHGLQISVYFYFWVNVQLRLLSYFVMPWGNSCTAEFKIQAFHYIFMTLLSAPFYLTGLSPLLVIWTN